jgi:hypothetical protein
MNSHFQKFCTAAQNGWLLLTRSEDNILAATIAISAGELGKRFVRKSASQD